MKTIPELCVKEAEGGFKLRKRNILKELYKLYEDVSREAF